MIDLISTVLGLNANNATFTFARLRNEHPEVTTNGGDFKFRGRGQKCMPMTDVRGAIELVLIQAASNLGGSSSQSIIADGHINTLTGGTLQAAPRSGQATPTILKPWKVVVKA